MDQLKDKVERGERDFGVEEGDEEEIPRQEEPEVPIDQRPLMNILKSMEWRTMDVKLDLLVFVGKMEPDIVMEWIDSLDNFFESEEIPEHQRVKMAQSKMKGAALTWWTFIQDERVKEGKRKVATWKKMMALVKEAYVLVDYNVQLHKRRQNLKQKEMDVISYIEEFMKCVKTKVKESEDEKVARYLNGLRFSIEEDLKLHTPEIVQFFF